MMSSTHQACLYKGKLLAYRAVSGFGRLREAWSAISCSIRIQASRPLSYMYTLNLHMYKLTSHLNSPLGYHIADFCAAHHAEDSS